MNFIIDIGNTKSKLALFDKDVLIDLKITNDFSIEEINSFTKENEKNITNSILCSVTDYSEDVKGYLIEKHNCIIFDETTRIPVINKYKTPNTLGKDRLAAVIGAQSIYAGNDILVIDAGTCITYDFINSMNEYLGGGISPGINMRFKSLHKFTGKLPLLYTEKNNEEIDYLIGKTSEESILSGVLNGVASEVDGIIERYKQIYPDIKIIICGGDTIFFVKNLKNAIFAIPNVILIGLNIILNYNAE